MLFGSVALFVFTLLFAPNELFDVPNISAWLALMFVAIGPTLGGYGLFNSALRYVPGKIAGLISVLEVPAATLLAFFMFGESLSALQIVGMILILIAAVLPNV
jgi:drug/metabolite transporter (DMT)-like permease